jgi:hypothetical protein
VGTKARLPVGKVGEEGLEGRQDGWRACFNGWS